MWCEKLLLLMLARNGTVPKISYFVDTDILGKISVRTYTLLQEQQKNVSCRLLEK